MKKPCIDDFVPSQKKIYRHVIFYRLLGFVTLPISILFIRYVEFFPSKDELNRTTAAAIRSKFGVIVDSYFLNKHEYIPCLMHWLSIALGVGMVIFTGYLLFTPKDTLYNKINLELNDLAQFKYEKALKKYERKTKCSDK